MSDLRTVAKDLKMPKDFSVTLFEAIYSRVAALREDFQDPWYEFTSAWTAVAYRFLSCSEHDKQFTESIHRLGNSPQMSERYIQERELFAFFTTGLATIECFSYGLFNVGSMLCPQHFSTKKPWLINSEKTAQCFEAAYQKSDLAVTLQKMVCGCCYRNWREIRNILCHRSAPGRLFHLGGEHSGEAMWKLGIQIDQNTTASKRKWLAETICNLLDATNIFTRQHFP